MRHLLLLPFGLTLYSLLSYAFSGVAFWAPLDPQSDGFVRFMLLAGFHCIGVFCGMFWFLEKGGEA